MWNSWAESRTDTWREAMVRAVLADDSGGGPAPRLRRRAAGRRRRRDFSFIVIGDTGEGDASQHVLRDQLLAVAEPARRALRRHLLGRRLSDRRDEGLRGEVLAAVQGRHASRSTRFPATTTGTTRSRRSRRRFSSPTPRARHARARRGRPAAHQHDRRPHRRADRARRRACAEQYGVPTGFQRAPFFEIQTDRFALIAVDTGVVQTRRPGAAGVAARRRSIARAASSTMAILGHPFYAGGHDADGGRRRVRAAQAACCSSTASRIVMAGDTHDLEYYAEPRAASARRCITSSTAAAARI